MKHTGIRLTQKNYAYVLQELMRNSGMSKTAIAERSGISFRTISMWRPEEEGGAVPSLIPLLCVLESMGYCLRVDTDIVTMRTVDDWYDGIIITSGMTSAETMEKYGADVPQVETWRQNGQTPMSCIWRFFEPQHIITEIVRLECENDHQQ